ncbi:hypothetical protein ALI22I_09415 [Saccharothrix sp. ALI-22-I]|uniref:restriction endonuclease-related protein n=1 Tax=Saccharothrix sp. ALI-22-I TaxID=1933778 RepID=UPI00097C1F5D|nr:hypothetical protein [Saccharothrix sp. ALI-22-I]ONI91278.1 hypothetical protein ALI22I_09415 [Saccharothrix sp. ALI-22-I]
MRLITTSESAATTKRGLDYLILTLLASGLAEIARRRHTSDRATGSRRHVPYRPLPLPDAWREASARLWWHYHEAGKVPPADDFELLELCRTAFDKWDAPLELSPVDRQSSLLDGDEMTDLATEAARAGTRDPGARFAEEQAYDALVTTAELNGTSEEDIQRNYVRLRRCLIEHPVVTDNEVRKLMKVFPASATQAQPVVLQLIDSAYERHVTGGAPVTIRICGDCGNLVSYSSDRCGTPGCVGQPYADTLRPLDAYYVQNRGVRKYIHDAGRLDVRLHDSLQRDLLDEPVLLELWPGRDTLDLLVSFLDPDNPDPAHPVEVWGADGKDHAAPGLLGARFTWNSRIPCDRKFLVLPEHRLDQPNYLVDLVTTLEGRVPDVRVMGEKDFAKRVVRHWREIRSR